MPASLRSLVLAAVGGVVIYFSFAPHTWWFLAPIGVALIVVALESGSSLRGGFGLGFVGGLALVLPLLPWVGVYVGPTPWIALSIVCALWYGVFGMVARLVRPLPYWPLWTAASWSLAEFGLSSFPFGGFPWARLAFSQADGPLLPIAQLGGAPLVSFAAAWIGVVVVYAWNHRTRTTALLALAGVAAPMAAGVLTAWTTPRPSGATITVAAIQGSVPRLGLEFNAQRRAVLDNHLRETERLAAAINDGSVKRPDVIVWPENSSDIDPLRNQDAHDLISDLVNRLKIPILVGAVLVNDDDTNTNSVIVWNPVTGPGDHHDKKIIQPFGEYIPYRSFFRMFSKYADMAGRFVPGHGTGVVSAGSVAVGIATCYEVVFDRAFRQSVQNGAQLLAVPTNNATFGDTDMTYQQMAMSRVRAVEHNRAVVVAATSGVSAIIAPTGEVMKRSELFEPATLVADVALNEDETVTDRLGPAVEILLAPWRLVRVLWQDCTGGRVVSANLNAWKKET